MASKKGNRGKGAGKAIPVRCKGSRTVPYDKLRHFQGDLKELSREDLEGLKSRILKHGWIAPVFVWNGNQIIDGHGRLLVLGELLNEGYTIGEIPVADIEAKSKKEAAQILLAVNSHYQKITGEGLYHFMSNMELDTKDLEGLSLPDIDVESFMKEFFKKESGGKTDPDEVPDVPAIPKTKLGNLWLLGKHRLLCGDSTKREDVERLMDGKKADMVFTDPPYGINVVKIRGGGVTKFGKIGGGGVTKFGKIGGGNWVSSNYYRPVHGDDKEFDPTFLLGMANKILLFGGNYYANRLPNSRCWLVWDKTGDDHIQNNFADCELIWTNMDTLSRIYRCKWRGLLKESGQDLKKRVHPTEKPVKLLTDILETYSEEGYIIEDLFLGSGTTLIACETINRICYGCEIEPHYCDVILDRWANYTGKDPVREDGVKWSELKAEKVNTQLRQQGFAQT